MKNEITKFSFIDAGLTALYVSSIGFFFFYISKIFAFSKEDTVFAPILMLSLLVFSVALVGSLIFGRPILWYLDGKKKEAVSLLAYTLAFLFVFICLIFAAIVGSGLFLSSYS